MAESKSKVLIIGATGYIGTYLVRASVKLEHPTFILVRSLTPSDPAKAQLIKSFQDSGVTVLKGDVGDRESLVAALRQVDVVISSVNQAEALSSQVNILEAAKETGTIKRFIPSEFGNEVDRLEIDFKVLEGVFQKKRNVRREIEKSGIPYTVVLNGGFAGIFVAGLANDKVSAPPRDKVTIWGDGTAKAILNTEEDIATYTIKSVDDPRTANKLLHIRPKENFLSQGELVALWEKKIGHTLEKTVVSKEELKKIIEESPFPANSRYAIRHSIFVKGDQTSFELGESDKDVEATELYPDVHYTTVSTYLDQFV
ncbi:hypothetical protein R1sor_011290 [Riccia sorocarpa]|uniref:NmrA-like domain-containing protein n=1 Tax=Riccia sorocarpa TaxID=122646 RepID=A0ABD3I3X5_9MARC